MVRVIVGCGYLGLRVAKRWRQSGDSVLVLSRQPKILKKRADELGVAGLEVLKGDLTVPTSLPELPPADTVLISVGMDRSRYHYIRQVYVEGLKNLIPRLSLQTRSIIYISSTGVYGKVEDCRDGWIDEDSTAIPIRAGGIACLKAEQVLRGSSFSDRTTILRFAGIYGPGRIPLYDAVLSRQWERLSANGFLNLIHVDDGARVIERISSERCRRQLFLVSDGRPVPRREFYGLLAQLVGAGSIPWLDRRHTEIPDAVRKWRNQQGSEKRISNRNLVGDLQFSFTYLDYRSGLTSLLPGKN
jgi:nucleoside-diphosphate-sugar epimerase